MTKTPLMLPMLPVGCYLQSLLFEIKLNDPRTLAAVAFLLLFLGIFSAISPAVYGQQ